MVYNFKGQVKIEDVQKAFDDMVARVNALREKYELSLSAANYNLEVGQATLAPDRYALSVGGLKQILNDANGIILGCRIYKSGNNFYCSEGIRITSTGVTRIKAQKISGTGHYVVLSNQSTGAVQRVTTPASGAIVISKINARQTENGICELVQALGDASSKKIFAGNNGADINSYQTRTGTNECFIGFSVHDNDWDKHLVITFNGFEIGSTRRTGHRNSKFSMLWQHFFLPKGVASPFVIPSYGVLPKISQVINK